MESTNSSLKDLSDIILPPPVPLWPFGQGAYLLIIAIVLTMVFFAYLYKKRYRANQYRRVGLHLLTSAITVYDVSVILKRVALAAFPREKVASLYGDQWAIFLGETCPGCNVEKLRSNPKNVADKRLLDAAALWIRNHKVNPKG